MADLYGVIKGMIGDSLGSYELCDMELGLVTSIKPLKVKISDRITLEQTQVVLTQAVVHRTIYHPELGTHIVVSEGLKVGDEVLLLKVAKGQKYIILSKVVNP